MKRRLFGKTGESGVSQPLQKKGMVMKKNTAIWLDHRDALLVHIEGETISVDHLESGAESHFKPSGGWKAGGTSVAQSVVREKSAEESRKHQYHSFYRQIMNLLGDSDAIAVFGPGEAKKELAGEIGAVHGLREKISTVEPCDRMTENQFIAKVREHFAA